MSTKKGLFDDSDDEEFVPKDNAGAGATAATEAIPKEESEIKKVEEEKTNPTTAK